MLRNSFSFIKNNVAKPINFGSKVYNRDYSTKHPNKYINCFQINNVDSNYKTTLDIKTQHYIDSTKSINNIPHIVLCEDNNQFTKQLGVATKASQVPIVKADGSVVTEKCEDLGPGIYVDPNSSLHQHVRVTDKNDVSEIPSNAFLAPLKMNAKRNIKAETFFNIDANLDAIYDAYTKKNGT